MSNSKVLLGCIFLLTVSFNKAIEEGGTIELDDRAKESSESLLNGAQKHLSVLMLNGFFVGHLFPLVSLGEELVKRGHNVTLCSTVMEGNKMLPSVPESVGIKFLSAGHDDMTQKDFLEISNGFAQLQNFMSLYSKLSAFGLNNTKKLHEAVDSINMDQYDIIVCDYSVLRVGAYHAVLGKRVIIFSSFIPPFNTIEPPWPIPPTFTNHDLGFVERLLTAVFLPLLMSFRSVGFSWMLELDEQTAEVLGGRDFIRYPGVCLPQLMTTVVGYAIPNVELPLKHYVGPVLKVELPAMEDELKAWLDSKQERKVIYISMGTTGHFSEDFVKSIIDGISRTDYDIIWALREDTRHLLDGVSIDTKKLLIQGWIPQQTLLKHSAIALTIHHCGLNTVQESLYNGLPVICLPHAFDQFQVAETVQNIEVGKSMYLVFDIVTGNKDFTASDMSNAIETVTSKKYVENARKLSKMYKFAGGAKIAADLVEFYADVGYDHLIPAFAKYNWTWVQYYNVDVYLVLIGLFVFLLLGLYKCICCCFYKCRSKAEVE